MVEAEPATKSVGYPLFFFSGGSHNPADSATYHFGAIPYAPYIAGTAAWRIYAPRAGFVRWFTCFNTVSGTLGSTEPGSVYLRVNAATDYLLTDSLLWNNITNGSGGDIDPEVIPIARNDYMEMIVVTPAWVTNPTVVTYWAQLWIEL